MGRGGHVAVFLFPRAPSLIRFIHVGFVVRDTKQPSMVDTMSAAEEGRIPYDAAKSTSHTHKTLFTVKLIFASHVPRVGR